MRHHHSRGLGLTSSAVRHRMVDELRSLGIVDERVLATIGRIARHEFVEEALSSEAYRNRSLPIGHAQTISQPYIVALMTQAALAGAARLTRVLEVGTGSGYQTAVLAEHAETVFTVERLRPLTESARLRLQRLGYRNVHFGYADGMQGWPPHAPYDAIVVTAAATVTPPGLADQLALGGRLVIPVGPSGAQELRLIERTASGLRERVLASVTFVPLLAGRA
ncbi:protein-L-isoaspartate(D-aspartate) O-methyltransferase [Hydrocarboniphaga daqingensis]|jgi:protein-L-isoaspartate(D-aspartate) O-methyltransferase|uniref:Protein-L-isoaspartate O-methyltransferase n=1 Tax=Hydrocarboniphaga daqingensis TaxID=490188 RepID=A0A1M5Q0E4_9GAMM|nr:protein-L-isoaspartate(D-aspartate) O-methyltransferase [Hydrocarboniphaga daqingensis]SHH07605.1 protein-L-isoaspartate(D-aspartate) O-methyltransferase [Hydrocarboniphaga daqingensis]